MPLNFTAAHSSRITKPRSRPPKLLGFIGDSSGSIRRQNKGSRKTQPLQDDGDGDGDGDDDEFESRLEDKGLIKTLATDLTLRDVIPVMSHIRLKMFDDVPTERSGMNSTRTAEVLNFRKSIPPIVTNSHVHALVNSPTSVEKEISKLVAAGLVKRITVPGRGSGASSLSDGLVLVEDWAHLVQEMKNLSVTAKEKYLSYLKSNDQRTANLQRYLTAEEIVSLMMAGLLTTSISSLRVSSDVLSVQRDGASGTLTSVHNISRAASGSINAVGGHGAVLESGGGGTSGLIASDTRSLTDVDLRASLPNTGAFLKLIEGSRSHLIHLLSKSKYNEAPMYVLRERWNGSINTKSPFGRSKDPFSVVLPGKTRKWKEFYGLNFDWVLAECLGAGIVEVFQTGSVGLGIRLC